MNKNFLLSNETALRIYEKVRNLPIIDYHCHLSPKEIYEDMPFDNIGELWLKNDHYKWRMMRICGIDEYFITGDADWYSKFEKYASCIESAAGSPLYSWTHMELSMYFGIEEHLCRKNALDIWERANKVIEDKKLSPLKLIKRSNVKYIATTDDISDDLGYHALIAEGGDRYVKTVPSFRTDNLLLIRRKNYKDYISKLSSVSGVNIKDIKTLHEAVCQRLDFFCKLGCRFTDVGIEDFPLSSEDPSNAETAFLKALKGDYITDSEYHGFLMHMFIFLAGEYKKRSLVMQLHTGVKRNVNTRIFKAVGPDAGCDCMGSRLYIESLIRFLDEADAAGDLPETIVYCLDPSYTAPLSAAAYSFRNVRVGAAWWFCDSKRGIEDNLKTLCELGNLGIFPGMLTDSRSFLSYARHDYFRRILCSVIGEYVEKEDYDINFAYDTAKAVCYKNMNNIIGEII